MKKTFIYKETEEGELVAIDNPEAVKEMTEKRYRYFLEKSGIPVSYYDIEFEDYQGDKNSESFRKIKYYADNCDKKEFDQVSLFIHGINTTQKTTLACNVLKEAIRKGLKVKFVLAGVLINKLMKLQGFNTDFELNNYINDLKDCDMILIDDCWDPKKSLLYKNDESNSFIISEWDIFFRDVLANKTKIISTSNFKKDVIQQYYGKSLYELVDRNFVDIECTDSIMNERVDYMSGLFDDM